MLNKYTQLEAVTKCTTDLFDGAGHATSLERERHLMNQGHVGLLQFDDHVFHYLCGGCNDPTQNTDIREWTENKTKAPDEPGPRWTAEV